MDYASETTLVGSSKLQGSKVASTVHWPVGEGARGPCCPYRRTAGCLCSWQGSLGKCSGILAVQSHVEPCSEPVKYNKHSSVQKGVATTIHAHTYTHHHLLLCLLLFSNGPGRFGRQLSSKDFCHSIPYLTRFLQEIKEHTVVARTWGTCTCATTQTAAMLLH